MKLSRVNEAVSQRLFTGGQLCFSSRCMTDHQEKPLIEGLFFAQISMQTLCSAAFVRQPTPLPYE
ncbi:hypothetical protein [Erwinia sorbitola]|uniref:Uncharacterized protein n=1 Tax=Erwinia sorbitola TaxID=2681984 RepID=A0ABW9RCC3_9GAMM|nr:hypothetical protein [Erwinia sorbitola]MTD27830.1 hypothetical protein [Erwinia sorbitola]